MLRPLVLLLALLPLPLAAQERSLTMTGSTRVEVVPDSIRIAAQVYENDESADALAVRLALRVEKLLAAAKPFGEAGASRLFVSHSKGNSGLLRSGGPGFGGWRAVTLHLADKDRLGKALDALADAGADGLDITHDIADRATLLAQARELAVEDAVLRAETYARAAGLTLGPIMELSESGSGGSGAAMHAPATSYGSSRKGKGARLANDGIGIHADVRIRWAIE